MSFSTFDELTTVLNIPTTEYQYQEQTTAYNTSELTTSVQVVIPEQTTAIYIQPETTAPLPSYPSPDEQTTAAYITEESTDSNEAVPSPVIPDYSSFTKGDILAVYKDAIEKTRGFEGNVNVNHTESFTADIKDAHPGGALTELLASNIVKLVGSEGQQTLSFTNKKAVNKDNEEIPLLLPQRTEFSLTEDGIKSAGISEKNGKLYVKIVLVPETVSMGEIPPHNASAIGYLDTSGMDFKVITISRVDITYPGSVIEAEILENGYIGKVTYTINMSTYAELSGMGISGYGTLEGAQTEKWEILW